MQMQEGRLESIGGHAHESDGISCFLNAGRWGFRGPNGVERENSITRVGIGGVRKLRWSLRFGKEDNFFLLLFVRHFLWAGGG